MSSLILEYMKNIETGEILNSCYGEFTVFAFSFMLDVSDIENLNV